MTTILPAVSAAAGGHPVALAVTGIQVKGLRATWYGTVVVDRGLVQGAPMAHMRSLARVVVAHLDDGGRAARIRFTMSHDGTRLAITLVAAAKGSQGPKAQRTPLPTIVPPSVTNPRPSDQLLDATTACGTVQLLISHLPLYRRPSDVSFADGLYLFYEEGEVSRHGIHGRIVRVGDHPNAKGGLVPRLESHYRSNRGAKNRSVFRRYLGGALLRRSDPASPCLRPGPGKGHWEKHHGSACKACAGLEQRVTSELQTRFRFRCVAIDDRTERRRLEARLIATIASCEACRPTSAWLGSHAYARKVQQSGLWNSRHVAGPPATKEDLKALRARVLSTLVTLATCDPVPLKETLLIIPCSGKKADARDAVDPQVPVRSMRDLLPPSVSHELDTARDRARERRFATFHLDGAEHPALAWYTGRAYETHGAKDLLIKALGLGLHCVIVSGGYGLVRPEEPIYSYDAYWPNMRPVWRRTVPEVLRAYVAHNHIKKTISILSNTYSDALPGTELARDDFRLVPPHLTDVDEGSAQTVVPALIGGLLDQVLHRLCEAHARVGP